MAMGQAPITGTGATLTLVCGQRMFLPLPSRWPTSTLHSDGMLVTVPTQRTCGRRPPFARGEHYP
jgi:hypothetical protein